MKNFDLVIIGSGPAGFSAAMRALDYHKRVCIIETDQIGGAGIMNGALLSKTLWELSADYFVASQVNRGYRASGLTVDFNEVRKTVIRAAKERQYQMLSQIETFSENNGSTGSLTLKYGHARFIDSKHVEITKSQSKEIVTSDYFLIATGAKPRELEGIIIDGEYFFNSDNIINLKKFPERLIIVGSGIIGCEFATIFSNFKQTEVHLIDRTSRVIPYEDDDLSDYVSKNLEKNGVKIHYQARLRSIRKKNHYLEVVLDYEDNHSKVFEVDAALISVGRIPNTKDLGLENIGLESDHDIYVKTNDHCIADDIKYNHIFAAGDITGHGQLYNIAQTQGRYIIDSIYGKQSEKITYKNMSTLMFFKPEVAAVGLNEKQLQQKMIPYKVAYYSNALVSRTIAMRNTDGFVKIIASNDGENRILGMRAAGPQASAYIVAVAHLIDEKNGLNEVFKTVHPHPGVTEGLEECLRLFNGSSVFKPLAFPEHIKYWEWTP
jgi:dihydrolipoamide dehydrogenase